MKTKTSFQPMPNIWNLSDQDRAKLQPGQWVYAGTRDHKGQYMGTRKSGVVVVAWLENTRSSGDYKAQRDYLSTLRNYSKA